MDALGCQSALQALRAENLRFSGEREPFSMRLESFLDELNVPRSPEWAPTCGLATDESVAEVEPEDQAEALSAAYDTIRQLRALVVELEQTLDEARREVGELNSEVAEARRATLASAKCSPASAGNLDNGEEEEEEEEVEEDCFTDAKRQLGVFQMANMSPLSLPSSGPANSGLSSPTSPGTPPMW